MLEEKLEHPTEQGKKGDGKNGLHGGIGYVTKGYNDDEVAAASLVRWVLYDDLSSEGTGQS